MPLQFLAEYTESQSRDLEVGSGEGSMKELSVSRVPSGVPQVVSRKYFLLFDINGTLIHWKKFTIDPSGKSSKKREQKARPGLTELLDWCLDHSENFEVCFWSCVVERNLAPRIDFIREKVPRLPDNCLAFDQSMCLESAHRDEGDPSKPLFLKSIAHLLANSPDLVGRGATEENVLLIDDSPYKNVLNDPFSAFHPTSCTQYSEAKLKPGSKPFFLQVLKPLLQKLLNSWKSVPDFFKANATYGQARILSDDPRFKLLKMLAPSK